MEGKSSGAAASEHHERAERTADDDDRSDAIALLPAPKNAQPPYLLKACAMSPEVWSAAASVGTFVIITVTAIAALVQLRHLRSSNQLQALIDLGQQFVRVSSYYSWVYQDLPEKMKSPEFRREIGIVVDPDLHPELIVASFFDQQGMIIKHKMMDERLIMEYGGGADVILRCWINLKGVIAIRRERAPSVYQNFEYLAMRAQKWLARFPNGEYPSDEPRMPLDKPQY